MTRSGINIIRGKLMSNNANQEEIDLFLDYVSRMEDLLDYADYDDYFGTQGWRHNIEIEE